MKRVLMEAQFTLIYKKIVVLVLITRTVRSSTNKKKTGLLMIFNQESSWDRENSEKSSLQEKNKANLQLP